jgi:uncharacterized protein (TIGR04255 family)
MPTGESQQWDKLDYKQCYRMSGLFPLTVREHYGKAPLISVVCQLRFPKLLAIESAAPVDFQEKVRAIFPFVQREQQLALELPPEFSQLVGRQFGVPGYQFLTEDKSYALSLGSEAISLSTTSYSRWEKFRELLNLAADSLNEVYKPAFFTRVGLRYQDAIKRSDLGLIGVPWSRLIRRELLGELSIAEFEAQLEGIADRALRLRNPDGSGSIMLRHGIGQVVNTTEPAYVIDLDFFTENKTEVSHAIDVATNFNRQAGDAFRWCITAELRAALEPVSISG